MIVQRHVTAGLEAVRDAFAHCLGDLGQTYLAIADGDGFGRDSLVHVYSVTRDGTYWGNDGVTPGYDTVAYSAKGGMHQAVVSVNSVTLTGEAGNPKVERRVPVSWTPPTAVLRNSEADVLTNRKTIRQRPQPPRAADLNRI